jgi:hypothetical protein
MYLQAIQRDSLSTLISVGRYTDEDMAIVERIFAKYEKKHGCGHSFPQTVSIN